jgi:chitodextrinase
MKSVWLFLIFALVSTQVALAQVDSSEFNIRIFGGTDNEVPTTPVLNTTTPITSTQIDIAWSMATDNYSVSGYSILRDNVPIATTTLLTYSDTGLLASTTYSYAVRAFDPAFNYSSTSNALATTTPDTPVPPVDDEENGQGTASRVIITDWRLEVGYSTTSIFLTTSRPSRF